ncbi:FAD-dependent thymidylate synthase [Desulfovibrio inopinatus]|uniref:FAD-dependent thymidylate synthase n=1 Tax=Desulfovibrio inopinatus TaxID=102109 RepID=UPI0003FEBEAC|nr:FAD-dependent thymidylate synthase [Desulfovibrio inopinatus]
MPVVQNLDVRLLAETPDALSLIYAAFRQCYHAGFVGDMWPKLLSGEISQDKQAEFIEKVMQSGHDSPIEHVSFTFAISGVSRALTHQLVRHRIASYSQQSQRYVDAGGFGYIMPPAIAGIPEAKEVFESFMAHAEETYGKLQELLAHRGKKSNEDARFVLPNAAGSKIVVTMNCRSLIHFFELRCCMRAQWEIRALADLMLKECRMALPVVFAVAGAKCERLRYCPENAAFTCGKYPLLGQ